MKKIIFISSLMLVLIASLLGPVSNVSVVHAQTGCVGADGSPIDCPPTDAPSGGDDDSNDDSGGGDDDSNDDSGGGGSSGGNPNPSTVVTATPSPEPTATPLPLALSESDYLGSCTNDNFQECREQFECEDGLLVIKVDLYAPGGTKYDFYCIPHESDFLKEFPITQPLDEGESDYVGLCYYGDGFDKCLSDFLAQCDAEGGLYNETDDGVAAAIASCDTSQQAIATEAPVIAAAPTDDGGTEGNEDWDESCSWASCWAVDLACWMDGGSGYGVDDGAGGVIYHCDMPEETNSSPWLPWITVGALAILIGLLLPAVQKVREAAARTQSRSKKEWIEIESMAKANNDATPQTREHVLLNKDNGGTEASDYLLEIDGVKDESKAHIKKATLFVRKSGGDQQE